MTDVLLKPQMSIDIRSPSSTCCSVETKLREELCRAIPKVELHLHIEGTFEPELMFDIAKRNGVELKYKTVEELRAAYKFQNLQEFLDLYYQGMNVLLTEQDYFDLTYAYFKRVHADNVRHVEFFFDPQGHTERGVAFETVFNGIERALKQAEADFGITSYIIMSFLRHLSEESAFETLEQAMPFLDRIKAVGLDSSEVGNPPEKFERVYARCRELGLRSVAHAGEEGDVSYIWGAINALKVERIDHGVRCIESDEVLGYLLENKIALTVCPLSNEKLQVVKVLNDHNLKQLVDSGVRVTINSDDPAYFGGYMTDNYIECLKCLDLRSHDIVTMARNSVDASFLPPARKLELHRQIGAVLSLTEAAHWAAETN
jgi:adenosine deaminase